MLVRHAREPNLRDVRQRLPPALRLRDFALLWGSILTNGLAAQMLAVAIGWQVYVIHHNPFDLGLVGLMEFLPLPFLALPAGQLADHLPRRAVTAASYVLTILIAVGLVVVTLDGARKLWPFLALAAAAGVASVIGNPAARAMTREIVPEELIAGAMALRSVAGQIGSIAGARAPARRSSKRRSPCLPTARSRRFQSMKSSRRPISLAAVFTITSPIKRALPLTSPKPSAPRLRPKSRPPIPA